MTEGSRPSPESLMMVVMKTSEIWKLQNTGIAMSDFY